MIDSLNTCPSLIRVYLDDSPGLPVRTVIKINFRILNLKQSSHQITLNIIHFTKSPRVMVFHLMLTHCTKLLPVMNGTFKSCTSLDQLMGVWDDMQKWSQFQTMLNAREEQSLEVMNTCKRFSAHIQLRMAPICMVYNSVSQIIISKWSKYIFRIET